MKTIPQLTKALLVTCAVLMTAVSAITPARIAKAVNMSTVQVNPAYAWTAASQGFGLAADKVKLDALPTAAGLVTQIDTAIAAKVFPFGPWCATGSPPSTADHRMPSVCTTAPMVSPFLTAGWIIAPAAMTCTSISAAYVNAIQATDDIQFCLMNGATPTSLCTTLTPSVSSSTGTGSVAVTQAVMLGIRMLKSGAAASTANTGSRVGILCKSP